MSQETIEYHYGKHHQAYIDNLNGLIEGTDLAGLPIEEVIVKAEPGPIFNNSAQVYNHSFYWQCLTTPQGEDNAPSGKLAQAIDEAFTDFATFKAQFSEMASKHFGSGWAWLFVGKSGKLEMLAMHDAGTPIQDGLKPLLAVDVWEHAYYIDYRNKRPDYLAAIWQIIDWKFVESQYDTAAPKSLMLPE
jgi:Fe-Mn family superoxide dismutase